MKSMKLICLLSLFFIPGFLSAQSDPLDKLLNKYGNKPGFRYAEIETNMLSCNSENSSKNLEAKFISFKQDSTTDYNVSEIYNVFSERIKSQSYEALAIVKSSGNHIEMLVKRKGPVISGFVIMMAEENHAFFISASGEFNLKDKVRLKELMKCNFPEMIDKLGRDL